MSAPSQPLPTVKCERCSATLVQIGQPVPSGWGGKEWSVELRCPNARTHVAAASLDKLRGRPDHDDYRYAWIAGAWRRVLRLGWK